MKVWHGPMKLPGGDMLSWYVDRAHEKIRIFRVDNHSLQPLQDCKVDRLMGLVAQFHQNGPGGFSHDVGTEDTGAEGGDTKTQSVFVIVLVLYQQALVDQGRDQPVGGGLG